MMAMAKIVFLPPVICLSKAFAPLVHPFQPIGILSNVQQYTLEPLELVCWRQAELFEEGRIFAIQVASQLMK
jgi:hypothetical protein